MARDLLASWPASGTQRFKNLRVRMGGTQGRRRCTTEQHGWVLALGSCAAGRNVKVEN